jgi:hypothetical protein
MARGLELAFDRLGLEVVPKRGGPAVDGVGAG